MKSQELNFPDLEKIVWRKSRPGKEFCGAVPLHCAYIAIRATNMHKYAFFMPRGFSYA